MDFRSPAAAAPKRSGLKSFGCSWVRDSMSYRSRLTTRVEDCICRQAGRLAGLRPSPAPAPAFREGVDALLARTEVIEEVQVLLGKIERVDHVMPALLEPERQPARQPVPNCRD